MTLHQAIAHNRRDLLWRGAGGRIIVHRFDCDRRYGEGCSCRPRRLLVRGRKP
jgi:hypothetical protein